MQNFSANSLAFRVSAILSFLLFAIILLLKFSSGLVIEWYIILFMMIIFILVSFFILRNILYHFIYRRIKLIYKSISSVKEDKDVVGERFNMQSDLLKQVDKDVMLWAEKNRKEIEQWKHMAQYRKEFVGNVSHELKTPIFNIQGYTLTLLEGGLEDKRINTRYLSKIEKNINRMISIVTDLEAISKLEHGELTLRLSEFEPVELAKDIIDSLEDRAKEKSISMHLVTNYEKKVLVVADLEFIRQVFTNLILNSINYGKENGYVKVEFFDMDENLLIEVSDNGIGISEEDVPRVFERFFRVDKSRSTRSGGTGLGLAIVKHIIEAHKQTINVRSQIGIGTTLAFTLKKFKA
jgi:two-component system, OmpR family, phosphate regulon sensor histidine kinase PhoR